MVNYVITGGPGTGKTSVIDELENLGHDVLSEPARIVSTTDERFIGKSISEVDQRDFQDAILEIRKTMLGDMGEDVVFLDRGIGDTIAYRKIVGLDVPDELLDLAKGFNHDKIFVMDFLDFYETDGLRKESEDEQKALHNAIVDEYKSLGCEIIFVPFMSVEERARFILNKVGL